MLQPGSADAFPGGAEPCPGDGSPRELLARKCIDLDFEAVFQLNFSHAGDELRRMQIDTRGAE
eukprot:3462456-Lingulodinium_polyedra.AAC.1